MYTALGKKLLELAEFAPLNTHGPKFENAPPSLHPSEKSKLALELVHDKSDHQGGNYRVLLLYATEHGFWLDPITIEIMRRRLADAPPRFDRVFYLSIHDPKTGSLSEIYPGSPHHMFGEHSDDKLAGMNVIMPHPTEMEGRQAWECSGSIRYGNGMSPIRIKIDMPATLKIRGA